MTTGFDTRSISKHSLTVIFSPRLVLMPRLKNLIDPTMMMEKMRSCLSQLH